MSKSPVLLNFRLMKDDKAARKVVVRKNQFSMQRREFLYGTATVHYINVINFCDLLFSNENWNSTAAAETSTMISSEVGAKFSLHWRSVAAGSSLRQA